LYHDGQIPTKDFKKHHEPFKLEAEQKEKTITQIESEIDILEVHTLANDQVLHDARNLHKQWENFSKEDKKSIIEAITEKIVIGEKDIYITLSYLPVSIEETDQKTNDSNSSSNQSIVTLSNNSSGSNHQSHIVPFSKLVRLSNDRSMF
jgi:hypothetical protein